MTDIIDLSPHPCGHPRQSFVVKGEGYKLPCPGYDCGQSGRATAFPLLEQFGKCVEGGIAYWEERRTYVFERVPGASGVTYRFEYRLPLPRRERQNHHRIVT